MTTKESVALRLAMIELRLVLGVLESGEKNATELTVGFDEIGAIALRAGLYGSAVKLATDDMRKVIRDLEQRFPREAAR